MCRHLAYLGPPASLQSLLIDPPHGLYRQSWAPRFQRYGVVNADGFGVGWYADGDPVPARYRRGIPIWGDSSLPDVARVTRSGAVLKSVREDGLEVLSAMEAVIDSTYLWALVLGRLRAGLGLGAALAATIGAVRAAGGRGRLNFLATDGRSIAATTYGDTLFYRADAHSVTVASEPSDDSPGWTQVADGQLLTAVRGKVDLRPLFEDAEGDIPERDPSEGIVLH